MTESDVRKLFLQKLNLRIGEEMSRYVLYQLMNGEAAPGQIAVMGGNAQSGVPIRRFVDPAEVLAGRDHPLAEMPDSGDTHLH